ncbi:MAG: hypothetical protein ACM359_10210 [Bacillota bacterium]
MREDERVWTVKQIINDYVQSPSLTHLRDPHSLLRVAQEIVRRLDAAHSIWRKWDGQRELVLKSALGCWIPLEDLHHFLNAMPGPELTVTDVAQRLKAFEEDPYSATPREELHAGCLALYEHEKLEGTELPAIIGLLQDHIDREEERLRTEQKEHYRQTRDQDRVAREQRLLSGADCGWTQLQKSLNWYCRTNGRTYRLSPTNDKMWKLHRVSAVADDEGGRLIGTYQRRGDATKVVAELARQPEPR